jgi:hypothetical protein
MVVDFLEAVKVHPRRALAYAGPVRRVEAYTYIWMYIHKTHSKLPGH